MTGPLAPLCVAGVPAQVETVRWRRYVWIVLCIAAAVLSVSWAMIAMATGFAFVGIVCGALVTSMGAMAVTSGRSTRTTEQITVAWAGISRRPWGRPHSPSILMEWPDAIGVTVTSVGAVWQKLRLTSIDPDGTESTFFACGFRCERERGPWVTETILAIHRRESPRVDTGPDEDGC